MKSHALFSHSTLPATGCVHQFMSSVYLLFKSFRELNPAPPLQWVKLKDPTFLLLGISDDQQHPEAIYTHTHTHGHIYMDKSHIFVLYYSILVI